jgi:hypothetical protein
MAPSKPAGIPASRSAAAIAAAQSPQGSGKAGGAGRAAAFVAAGRGWRVAFGVVSGAAKAPAGKAASKNVKTPSPSSRLAAAML